MWLSSCFSLACSQVVPQGGWMIVFMAILDHALSQGGCGLSYFESCHFVTFCCHDMLLQDRILARLNRDTSSTRMTTACRFVKTNPTKTRLRGDRANQQEDQPLPVKLGGRLTCASLPASRMAGWRFVPMQQSRHIRNEVRKKGLDGEQWTGPSAFCSWNCECTCRPSDKVGPGNGTKR